MKFPAKPAFTTTDRLADQALRDRMQELRSRYELGDTLTAADAAAFSCYMIGHRDEFAPPVTA